MSLHWYLFTWRINLSDYSRSHEIWCPKMKQSQKVNFPKGNQLPTSFSSRKSHVWSLQRDIKLRQYITVNFSLQVLIHWSGLTVLMPNPTRQKNLGQVHRFNQCTLNTYYIQRIAIFQLHRNKFIRSNPIEKYLNSITPYKYIVFYSFMLSI